MSSPTFGNRPIRWGILGTGQVAQAFAQGLSALPDARLHAIGSRDADKARQFAAVYAAAKSYGSYEALVADAEVDIVYIATPHTRHRDDCLLALHAGKPVLCEKPFASSASEAREVIAVAREKNLFCMEAMWMRFMPLILKVRALIDEKAIGEVRLLTADNGRALRYDPAQRAFQAAAGGSCLLDRGVYGLALAQGLLGAPAQVTGQLSHSASGVDEQVGMVLRYANGAMALLASSLTAHTSNEAVITGTHGSIRIHAPFYNPTRVTVWTRAPRAAGDAAGIRRRSAKQKLVERLKLSTPAQWLIGHLDESQWPRRKGRKTEHFQPHSGNGYHYQAAEAMRCLRIATTESPCLSLDESLQVMAMVDDIKNQASLR